MDQETLHTYPCEYTFKVFGLAELRETLIPQVYAAVNQVVEGVGEDRVGQRCSSGGNYFCISVNAMLQSEEQRRRIYTLLQKLEGVRYIL
ncbi:MAG: DUF493 domain-containing protein [Desulfuromonadaceae bacterium]|nr:DUF493 domain-containing protein [Desulfuromonadaceae bacterium]